MESFRSYEHHYIDREGVSHTGCTLHKTDNDAVSYFRSVEANGGIKMHGLKNPNGCSIWSEECCYGRTRIPR